MGLHLYDSATFWTASVTILFYNQMENKFKNAFMSCKTFAVHRFFQCEYFFNSIKLTRTLEYINKQTLIGRN